MTICNFLGAMVGYVVFLDVVIMSILLIGYYKERIEKLYISANTLKYETKLSFHPI